MIQLVTDWILIDRMMHEALGNDRKGLILSQVARTPSQNVDAQAEYPTDSEARIEEDLQRTVVSNWKKFRTNLQRRIAEYAPLDGLKTLFADLAIHEVVTHCHYYDDPSIRYQLMSHLRSEQCEVEGTKLPNIPRSFPGPDSIRWAATGATTLILLALTLITSTEGRGLLRQAVISSIVRQAPFYDLQRSPDVRAAYLFSLVKIGKQDEALELLHGLDNYGEAFEVASRLTAILETTSPFAGRGEALTVFQNFLQQSFEQQWSSTARLRQTGAPQGLCIALEPLRETWSLSNIQTKLLAYLPPEARSITSEIVDTCWRNPIKAMPPNPLIVAAAFEESPLERNLKLHRYLIAKSPLSQREPMSERQLKTSMAEDGIELSDSRAHELSEELSRSSKSNIAYFYLDSFEDPDVDVLRLGEAIK